MNEMTVGQRVKEKSRSNPIEEAKAKARGFLLPHEELKTGTVVAVNSQLKVKVRWDNGTGPYSVFVSDLELEAKQ